MADVEELESKVNAQALQIKLLNEGQHKVNELMEENERLQKEHKEEMEKVKAQAKQAYLKLKQQLEAKEEQLQALKGAAPALGDGEGGPDGAASKLERADQRLAELEAQLQKATLETDKVKIDAKKYVETLKKKEQEALAAARLATERMHEAQTSAADMQARLEGELARVSESESGGGAVDSGEVAQLRGRIAELEGQVESLSRKATEEASQSSATVQMLREQLVQAASEADAYKEAHAKLQSCEQVIAEGQRQLEETRSALEASNAQAAALAKHSAEFEAKALQSAEWEAKALQSAEWEAKALQSAEWEAKASQLAGEIAQASQGDANRMSSLSQNLAEWQDRAKCLEEAFEREQQQVASVQEQLLLREEHSKQLEANVVALETSRVDDALASQQQIQSLNQQLSEWQARANQLEESLVDETKRREQSEADKIQTLEHAGELEKIVEEKREELERGLREHQAEKVRLEEMLHEARQAAAAADDGAPGEAVANEGVSNGEEKGALAAKNVEFEKEREELCRLREEQVKSKELMREMVDKMRAREAEKEAAAAAAIAEKDAVIAALEQHKAELLSQIQEGGQEKHGGEVEPTLGAAGEAVQGSSAPGDDAIKSVLGERDALLAGIRRALGCDEAGDILGMLAHAQAEKEESMARVAELEEQMREVAAAAHRGKTQQQAEVGLLDDQPLISFGFDFDVEGANAGQVQGAVMVDEAAADGEGEPERGQGSLMQNVQHDGGDLLGGVEEVGLQQPMPVQALDGATPAMDAPQSQAAEAWPQDPFGFDPFSGGMPQGEQNSMQQQQQQQEQEPLADEMSMHAPEQAVKEGVATETTRTGQIQREEKDTEERGLLESLVSRLTMSDEGLQGVSNLSLLKKINGYFDVARKEKAEVELQLAQQVKAWEASKKELEDKIAEETTKSEKFRRQFDKGTASHKEAMGKLQQDMANEHEKSLEAAQRMEAAEAEREALQKVVDGLTAELNKMREHVAVVGIESIQKRVEQLQSRCDDIENQGETSKEDIGQLQTLIIEETTLISNMAEELTSPPSGASQPRLSLDDGKVAIDTLVLSMEDLNMRISELTQQNEELRKQADEGTALKAEKGTSGEERALVEALMPKVGYEGSIEGESTVFLLGQLGPIFDTVRKEKVELELNLSKEQRALQSSMEEVEEERANAVKQMEISEKLRAQNQKSLDSHKKREQNLKDQQSSMQEEMDKLALENEQLKSDQLKLSNESKGAVDSELKSAYDALVESERATADEILSLKEEISEKKKRITEMKNSFSQGMEASKLHVAQLENTIKELQEGAEKATRTAESAAVGTEERSTMVHDEPAETASRAGATVSGLQNGQGTPGKLDEQGRRALDKEAPHDDSQEGLRAQVEMLKKEVAELNARVRAEGVPQEYLKEVVLKYVLSSPQLGLGPREHEDMIPIIADLMHFSESDRFNVARTQERAKNKSILSAATSFLWDPSRY